MKKRTADIKRNTRETKIKLFLNIDGRGEYRIKTEVPFLDHMLELFAKHGLFDLKIASKGDIQLGYHHVVEDIGICLGDAVKKALGNKKGIKRYGQAALPMDESLATVHLDISGRPYLVDRPKNVFSGKIGDFNCRLVKEFFQAFCNHSGMTLHITLEYGEDKHHIIEAIFKAFAKALDIATQKDPRVKAVPSTKGRI